jgi:flagellar assembly protein FliH
MSNSDLVRAIRAIREEWEIEEKIRQASEVFHKKELEKAKIELDEARKQAESIVEKARAEADEIIKEGQNQVSVLVKQKETEYETRNQELENQYQEKLQDLRSREEQAAEQMQTGFDKGHEEGFQKGYAEGLSQFENMLDSLKKVVDEVGARPEQLVETELPQIQSFILKYAEKIVGILSQDNINVVFHNIKDALQELTRATRIKVVVSESDYESITAMQDKFQQLFPPTANVELLKDVSLQAGGCVLECETGSVDATIESQLALLKKELCHDG